ncbi:MAG: glycosyltransferase family 4 protein [Gemmatimonadaceae bacterium]
MRARTTAAGPTAAERPLRILHLDTERGWRGGERQLLWLAEELRRQGHLCYVAARSGELLADRSRRRGMPTVSCNPAGEADLIAAMRLRRMLRLLDVEVIHAHTAHALALAVLATMGRPIPVVAARRVDFPLRRNAATRWKYAHAAAVVAVSGAVRDVLVRGGLPARRVTVVHDGVDLEREIVAASPEALSALGVPPGAPLAVQVAQMVGHKDPVTFVRAVAAARQVVPGLHALLVGEGDERPAVERTIAELGLGGTVHLTGYRTDADSLLAAADVAVLSSREEGMGSVLLDALMLGRPAVATRAGGIPEVLEDGVSGLLAPVGDAAALGAAIARVLTEPELAARLGTAGRARVERFSMPRTAAATLEVYRRVLLDR